MAQPVRSAKTGQFLAVFEPDNVGTEDNNYNFSDNNAGFPWNTAPTIPTVPPATLNVPVEQTLQCLPLTPGLPPVCEIVPALTWFGDGWSFSNTFALLDTVTGLAFPAGGSMSSSKEVVAATTDWTSSSVLPGSPQPYPFYPDWSVAPLTAATPAEGADGPKSAFNAGSASALISSSLNNVPPDAPPGAPIGGFPTLLRVYGEASLGSLCQGNPSEDPSSNCPQVACVNVSPPPSRAGFSPPLASCSAATPCDTSCYDAETTGQVSYFGSRFNGVSTLFGPTGWVTHAPVVGFDSREWVAFMQGAVNLTATTFNPWLTLAAYQPDLSTQQVIWYTFSMPTSLFPCPTGGDANSCIPDCGGAFPIRLVQAPALASGTISVAGVTKRLLYVAWNAQALNVQPIGTPAGPPVEGIYEMTFEVDDTVAPPRLLLFNMKLPTNQYHNEFLPALAADPNTGDVGLFYYSDEGSTCAAGTVDCPTDSCNAHVLACVSSNGGGPGPLSNLNDCFQISSAFPIEPRGSPGNAPGFMADFMGATPLLGAHELLATWTQPQPNPTACSTTTGDELAGRSATVDPGQSFNSCRQAEEAGRKFCRDQDGACDADAGECETDDRGGRDNDRGGGKHDHPKCDEDNGKGERKKKACEQQEKACEQEIEAAVDRCQQIQALEEVALQRIPPQPAVSSPIAVQSTTPALQLGPLPVAPALGGACATNGECSTSGGFACVNGHCGCPLGLALCGPLPGICVDPSSDSDHCGVCGVQCPAGANCSSGFCACDGGPCPPPSPPAPCDGGPSCDGGRFE